MRGRLFFTVGDTEKVLAASGPAFVLARVPSVLIHRLLTSDCSDGLAPAIVRPAGTNTDSSGRPGRVAVQVIPKGFTARVYSCQLRSWANKIGLPCG